jgi:hypothetical protein
MKPVTSRTALLVAAAVLAALATPKKALAETRTWGLTVPRGGALGSQGQSLPWLHMQPQRNVPQDYVLGAPVSLPCFLRGGELIWIENATGARLYKGTPVSWQTSAGEQGTAPLPHDIDPNLPIGLLRVNDAETCTAQVMPRRPVLAQ